MAKFKTVDFRKLNQSIYTHDFRFKNQQQLGKYYINHPKLLASVLTHALPAPRVMLMAICWFVPELRLEEHDVVSKFYPLPEPQFVFFFHNAQQHSDKYWQNMKDDFCHSQKIPIWKKKLIRVKHSLHFKYILTGGIFHLYKMFYQKQKIHLAPINLDINKPLVGVKNHTHITRQNVNLKKMKKKLLPNNLWQYYNYQSIFYVQYYNNKGKKKHADKS